MPTEENIRFADGKIVLGSPARQITAMHVKAGRMRAVIEVRGTVGNSEAFITREEMRALSKWLTQRVKDADREDRWQRLRSILRLGR
jgi:hypothetical protein